MDEVLDERDGPPVGVSVQGATDETEDDSVASSQDDQTISALRRVMEQCSQTFLRHRQVSAMLQARLSERDRQRQAEEAVYRRRKLTCRRDSHANMWPYFRGIHWNRCRRKLKTI